MKTNTHQTESQKKPLHPVLWSVGSVFFLGGVASLIFNSLAAFPLFIVSAAYLPPARDFLYLRMNIEICKRCRFVITLFGVALFFLAIEKF
jgi:hypothetical protein